MTETERRRPRKIGNASVLHAIKEFWALNHYAPSIRDLCDMTGISSTGQMKDRLQELLDEGLISWTPGVSRSIIVVKAK